MYILFVMKLIETKEYKGFNTTFYLMPKTEIFLSEKRINMKEHIPDTFHWYEHVIFGLLDPKLDRNWSQEKETRRNFKVVFYGIIEQWIDKKQDGFVEEFDYDPSTILSENTIIIHPKNHKLFAVRERIFIL